MISRHTIDDLKALFHQQRFDHLIDAAGELLNREPDNVAALYWRACAFMRHDRLDEALADLNRAIALYDEYADAYSQRGVLYFRKGARHRALADMDFAVQLEPANSYRYSSRAYVKASMNELENAIRDYEKAIALDPEDAVAHNNLGLLQEQLGYKSQARRNLERAGQLAVTRNGELVQQSQTTIATEEVPPSDPVPGTYASVIRETFTTRRGFRNYLRYLQSLLSGLLGSKK